MEYLLIYSEGLTVSNNGKHDYLHRTVYWNADLKQCEEVTVWPGGRVTSMLYNDTSFRGDELITDGEFL